jgi:hypothetical protein
MDEQCIKYSEAGDRRLIVLIQVTVTVTNLLLLYLRKLYLVTKP